VNLDYDAEHLPAELRHLVDRPRSGQGVFFPVLGARRAIGLIYADNGRRSSSIRDVELMELATAQVGLAFENELLRRQLDRVGLGLAS
jgi:GAF domain-containing protein